MNIKTLIARSKQIQELVEALKADTYVTVEYVFEGKSFFFFASFNIELCEMEYNITNGEFMDLKTFGQVPPRVLKAYGEFIGNMLNFEAGGPLVYSAAQSDVKPLSVADLAARASKAASDEDLSDDEASLR